MPDPFDLICDEIFDLPVGHVGKLAGEEALAVIALGRRRPRFHVGSVIPNLDAAMLAQMRAMGGSATDGFPGNHRFVFRDVPHDLGAGFGLISLLLWNNLAIPENKRTH